MEIVSTINTNHAASVHGSMNRRSSSTSAGGGLKRRYRKTSAPYAGAANTKYRSSSNAAARVGNGSNHVDRVDVTRWLFDLYAYNPTYQWGSFTTWFGYGCSICTVCFLLFYIGVTTHDYIVVPPDLVKLNAFRLPDEPDVLRFPVPSPMGLGVYYTDAGGIDHFVNASNTDRMFQYTFEHTTIINSDASSKIKTNVPGTYCEYRGLQYVCVDPETTQNMTIQGDFLLRKYEYLKISVRRCIGMTSNGEPCASDEEVNQLVHEGRVTIGLIVRTYDFDPELYHNQQNRYESQSPTRGIVPYERGYRWYATPGILNVYEIFLKARTVESDDRWIGTPPMPGKEYQFLGFDGLLQTVTEPVANRTSQEDYAEFFIRLDRIGSHENLTYWAGSILDLFGLWGAMASFLGSLSIGFVASEYNRWLFERHYKRAIKENSNGTSPVASSKSHDSGTRTSDSLCDATITEMSTSKSTGEPEHLTYPIDKIDIRLLDHEHFNHRGRLHWDPLELAIPTTVYGELRRMALQEHRKRRKAAELISAWYLTTLVRRGKLAQLGRFELIRNDRRASRLSLLTVNSIFEGVRPIPTHKFRERIPSKVC